MREGPKYLETDRRKATIEKAYLLMAEMSDASTLTDPPKGGKKKVAGKATIKEAE